MYSGIDHQKTPYTLVREDIVAAPPPDMERPAPTDQSFSSDFINFMKNLENDNKTGFHKGKWYPHKSPEGGRPTIAYGHKILTYKEEKKFASGIDDREATKLLIKDLVEAKEKVHKYIREKYKVNLILDQKQTEILVEFTFNLGGLNKFPKFTDAVLRKNWDKAEKEYKRHYRTPSGEVKELSRRNSLVYGRYFK